MYLLYFQLIQQQQQQQQAALVAASSTPAAANLAAQLSNAGSYLSPAIAAAGLPGINGLTSGVVTPTTGKFFRCAERSLKWGKVKKQKKATYHFKFVLPYLAQALKAA